MFGSIFYNFWGALGSFATYFFWAFQQPMALPLPVILQSFLAAVVGFVLMFAVRYLIGYVMYTPEQVELSEMTVPENAEGDTFDQDLLMQKKDDTIVEFEEEDSEEIAKVVRTMLHGQEEIPSN